MKNFALSTSMSVPKINKSTNSNANLTAKPNTSRIAEASTAKTPCMAVAKKALQYAICKVFAPFRKSVLGCAKDGNAKA
eukprot:992798-Amphidinium_carterae.1